METTSETVDQEEWAACFTVTAFGGTFLPHPHPHPTYLTSHSLGKALDAHTLLPNSFSVEGWHSSDVIAIPAVLNEFHVSR